MHAHPWGKNRDLISPLLPSLFVTQMKSWWWRWRRWRCASGEDQLSRPQSGDEGSVRCGQDSSRSDWESGSGLGSESGSFFSIQNLVCHGLEWGAELRGRLSGLGGLGSGIVIYRYPRTVVGLGHVTRTAGTMDTCAQWVLGLDLGLSAFVRPSMCAMSND